MAEHLIPYVFELAAQLDQHGWGFVVMGGFAVRSHSIPRATYDIDFTLEMTVADLDQLVAFLREVGYDVPEIYDTGWVDRVAGMPVVKARKYINDQYFDLDVFLTDTPFQKSYIARRKKYHLDGRLIWVCTPEDLVLLKLLANRNRDIGDAHDVLFMMPVLDFEYMLHWAIEMGFEERFRSVLKEHDEYLPFLNN